MRQVDKYITHKAYTWANEFNKYIKDIRKCKTKKELDEQIEKLLKEKDKKIEELKTVVDKSICEDIEREDNPKRCFLIIGEDEDLIEGIVSYIFCFYLTKDKLFFNSEDFTGNDDETIKEKLIYQCDSYTFMRQSFYSIDRSYSNLIDLMEGIERSICDLLLYFQYGGTLFLRNLKSQDCAMLKSIAMKIRDIVTKNADSHGTLIISTDNKDNLSDYFKNQFKIINLEPEKQSKAVGISQTKNKSGKQANIKPNIAPIEVLPSTKWEDITIHFTDIENVQISIKDTRPIKRHLAEMGLKPKSLLAKIILFYAIAENKPLQPKIFKDITTDLKSQISDLRQALRSLFIDSDGNSISGDPFPWDYSGKCYKPRIKLTSTSDVKAHQESLLENQYTTHHEILKKNPQKTSVIKGLKLKQNSEENNDYQYSINDSD